MPHARDEYDAQFFGLYKVSVDHCASYLWIQSDLLVEGFVRWCDHTVLVTERVRPCRPALASTDPTLAEDTACRKREIICKE